MVNRLLKIAVLGLLVFYPGLSTAAPQPMDFFIIQPGQPGSAEEARPVMEALAAYLQQKLGGEVAISGTYFNQTEQALTAIERSTPRWGIVSLGFFVENGGRFAMQPIASTRPAGKTHERWYLMVARGGAGTWRQLSGSVLGTMLFQQQSASRLMFATSREDLPFALEGTASPLRALREVAGGKKAGVILDQSQYQALQALPLFGKLEVLHRSEPLPTAPVVWFGEPDDSARKLTGVLQQMVDDPAAKNLLQLLQTEGFGPADPSLAGYVQEEGKGNRAIER
jgi:hypothetical protein